MRKRILLFFTGLVFAILWSSASTATKLGLQAAQPLVICVTRFFLAGVLMLVIAHLVLRSRLPVGREWGQLAVYGLLNISLYLGLYVVAMQHVSPGLGSLAIATNPVFINLISALFFRQRLRIYTLLSLLLCSAGVVLAAWPLLQNSAATPGGLLLLLVSMLAYSAGVLYFSRVPWNGLSILAINGWQTLIGGAFLLPFAAFAYDASRNSWDWHTIGAVLWLAIPVSIFAVQLWLYLLRDNAARASFWLFLCPVSGFLIANVVMKEPIGVYTISGMVLVIGGLYLVLSKKGV
ncbi:DMT family transporter [Flavitalea sp. BT771]|uniref:DMT family transporter n=1 Tax=Flavitalea sp. BT771 TaxID=3063329 RepID=UPI0026E3B177|nr:DMT family transporter [Flavitalea sp. BT771]MDO6430719.1 DMT family transporter [Flavitalea sp. BT771]MDV6219141.1 DMT family transporter [Flavitalea sp. BT771]